jgi:deoxyguanosine kinase
MPAHSVLISVKATMSQGVRPLKDSLKQIQGAFVILKSSSVYKVNEFEMGEGFVIVVKAQTELTPQESSRELARVERWLQSDVLKKAVSISLLSYDDETHVTPELSLPNPEMHMRPEEVVPAAEVWPDYRHPVLNETLAELAQRHAKNQWGEFFSQGQPLLDF